MMFFTYLYQLRYPKAAMNVEQAVRLFRELGETSNNYYDALAVQGIVELKMYASDIFQKDHLRIARTNFDEIKKHRFAVVNSADTTHEFGKHVNALKEESDKYKNIKIR